jgi:BASS family bile acid:Na+ symporter
MQELDFIKINFSQQQLSLLNFCLAFIMYGVSLEIDREQIKELASNFKSTIIGLASQILLLPLLTALFIYVLKPSPSIALGMIIISACPGGNVSNYATNLANGNVSLSVALTIASSLLSVVTTPLIFQMLSSSLLSNNTLVSVSFVDMFTSTIKLILIPLILGLYMQMKYINIVKKILPFVKVISVLIFLAFILLAIWGNLDNLKNYIHFVFFYVIIHNLSALAIGYVFPKTLGIKEMDCKTISIETGIQNSGLGLVLVFNFFNGNGGMALMTAWWSIWHLISAAILAGFWKNK